MSAATQVNWDDERNSYRQRRQSVLNARPPLLPLPSVKSTALAAAFEKTTIVDETDEDILDVPSSDIESVSAFDDPTGGNSSPTTQAQPLTPTSGSAAPASCNLATASAQTGQGSQVNPASTVEFDVLNATEDDENRVMFIPQNWSEFTSPKHPNLTLYFSPAFQAVSVNRIPSVADKPKLLRPANLHARANRVDAEERRRLRRRAAQGGGANPEDDEEGDEEDEDGKAGKEKDEFDGTYGRISSSLSELNDLVERILSYSAALPSLAEQLQLIKNQVALAEDALRNAKLEEAKASKSMERSDVDFLIGWNKLPWKFEDNPSVDYYRAASRQTDHAALTYEQWHVPEYFSDHPLLPTWNKINCTILFPFLPEGTAILQSRVDVGPDDTTLKVLERAHTKLPKHVQEQIPPSGFVLKVQGYHEFFLPDCYLFEYAHVRKALRDRAETITLLMLPRPDADLTEAQKARDELHLQDYERKVPRNITLCTKTSHRDVPAGWTFGSNQKALQMSSVNTPFRTRIVGIENITPSSMPSLSRNITQLVVRATLFHGTTVLGFADMETPSMDVATDIHIGSTLVGSGQNMLISTLPRETRIVYMIVGITDDKRGTEIPLAWVVQQLVDEHGVLVSGCKRLGLWPVAKKDGKQHGKKRSFDPSFYFRATNVDNRTVGAHPAVLTVEYDTFPLPVVAPLVESYHEPNVKVVGMERQNPLDPISAKLLVDTIRSDPLADLTPEMKNLLWNCRHYLIDIPQALPKVLQCVNWGRPDSRHEAYRLLSLWRTPAALHDVLELLDVTYADYAVREYAVGILRQMTDEQLQMYLLQLVQCLKFEPYHDSPLSRFLIERAIASPYFVGHTFFWHLKAELHNPWVSERFGLLLEEFLSHVGRQAHELRKQLMVVQKLQKVAEMVVMLRREGKISDETLKEIYHNDLRKLNAEFFSTLGGFQVPLNPRWVATELVVEKCKFMSSKMVPLWLVFKNADETAKPITVIFKSGDDLRQDLLTLQLLRVMDRLWLADGLDMCLKPYGCIATGVNDVGEGVGMIEVVLNSTTTSDIQVTLGGGAMGALRDEPIDKFIRQHNRDAVSYHRAVNNFIRSCAGYCVATFVLGIGDRHNGNIMVTESGHLFHIDFGHFLGNFKTKFGIRRERAAFVCTPEMVFVMGGKQWRQSKLFQLFKRCCSRSFRILRAHANLLENLFLLMVAAGMPELLNERDIDYLKEKFHLDVDTSKAVEKLYEELDKSIESTYRRIDNLIHNIKHHR